MSNPTPGGQAMVGGCSGCMLLPTLTLLVLVLAGVYYAFEPIWPYVGVLGMVITGIMVIRQYRNETRE